MRVLLPAYLELYRRGELAARVEWALEVYEECSLCPHRCGIDRSTKAGVCRAPEQAVVSSFGPHYGEERVLVGSRGSGTIFFAHCTLACVYCQNSEISLGGRGRAVSGSELGEIMLELQKGHGCPNVNLVSPTHFVPSILAGLLYAVERGFRLPLVYNCGGYENPATLELLDGIIDIYMPDFKYAEPERAEKYSGAEDYPQKAKEALLEMDRQVGGLKTDGRGIAVRGLLIRHLMPPGGLADTKKVLRFINDNLSADCLVNLMDQYYPHFRAFQFPELGRRLTRDEYNEALEFASSLGLRLVQS